MIREIDKLGAVDIFFNDTSIACANDFDHAEAEAVLRRSLFLRVKFNFRFGL